MRICLPRLCSAALALAWCGIVAAQTGDANNGRLIYASWCAACHNANPRLDAHGIINGASNAGFILSEWRTVPDMQFLLVALPDPAQAAADVAAYLATLGDTGPPTVAAIEYFYADWGYYFETAFPDEIAALDGGAFGGVWQRTGQTFNVWPQPNGSALPTCRFFSTSFAPKSSHFYTPLPAECEFRKTDPNWEFESIAFYIQWIDASGNCSAGTVPLYRFYNNGMGGAPNHRYTTSLAIFNQMQAGGWAFEGDSVTKIFACVPQ